MADNIKVTQGTGTTIATDEVGGVHYPRTKLVFGPPDTAPFDVSSAARLPVNVNDSLVEDLAKEQTLQTIVSMLLYDPSPVVARQLSAGASSANTALTSSVRRVSIYASGANIRYSVGAGAQTASATSHYIAQGERLMISVPAGAQIAVIRANATDGTLELSELS